MTIQLRDVTLRDGLQDEPVLDLATKIEVFDALVGAGVRELEIGSFVRADRVPAMADTDDLAAATAGADAVRWGLVLNARGAARAMAAGLTHLEFVLSVSEAHNRANAGQSVEESLAELARVIMSCPATTLIEVTLATAFGCPFTGPVPQGDVVRLAERVMSAGAHRLSLADTIGVAVPAEVRTLATALARDLPPPLLGIHFHDTRGTAMANAFAALDSGIRRLDASTAGLGGCPYAPGATGNLALEDLVHALHASGEPTGIDLHRLLATSRLVAARVGREPESHLSRAGPRFVGSGGIGAAATPGQP